MTHYFYAQKRGILLNEVTSDVLNQVRKSNTEYFSSLNSALAQGIMNMNEVQNKISMKRKEIIEEHEKSWRLVTLNATTHLGYLFSSIEQKGL